MKRSSDAPKILYIAGYGRSGSTLLSILLDNLPGVVSLGGVAGLPRYLGVPGRECSCNHSYFDCPLWGEVLDRIPVHNGLKELGHLQRKIESWNKGWSVTREDQKRYAKRITRFFNVVADVTDAQVLVDSSKSAYPYMWRALALRRAANLDVFVIHLVRHAEGVVSSCKKGRNIDLELDREGRSGLWASSVGLLGWMSANIAATWTRKHFGDKESMVSWYKDIVHSPKRELRRVANKSDLSQDVSMAFGQNEEFEIGHLVGGNRMSRRNKKIQIDSSKSATSRLTGLESFITKVVGHTTKKVINMT